MPVKPSKRKIAKANKSAMAEVNKKRGTAVTKLYGKTVMRDTKDGKGQMGYASVAKTNLPKMGTRKLKAGSPQQRQSMKNLRRKSN